MSRDEEYAQALVNTIAVSSEIYNENIRLTRMAGVIGGVLAGVGFFMEQLNAEKVDLLSAGMLVGGVALAFMAGVTGAVAERRHEQRVDAVDDRFAQTA